MGALGTEKSGSPLERWACVVTFGNNHASKLDCSLPEGESPRFSDKFGQLEGHYNKTSQAT